MLHNNQNVVVQHLFQLEITSNVKTNQNCNKMKNCKNMNPKTEKQLCLSFKLALMKANQIISITPL